MFFLDETLRVTSSIILNELHIKSRHLTLRILFFAKACQCFHAAESSNNIPDIYMEGFIRTGIATSTGRHLTGSETL